MTGSWKTEWKKNHYCCYRDFPMYVPVTRKKQNVTRCAVCATKGIRRESWAMLVWCTSVCNTMLQYLPLPTHMHTCTHTLHYKNKSPAFTTADQQHDDNGNYPL